MSNASPKKFVVLGGGTGSFNVLSSLKNHVDDITALVNMADDGGSTGKLRDEYGVLPPGDVRQCLVALSSSPHLRDLFNFRFPKDTSLGGHSFGNLFLSALEMQNGSFANAIEVAGEVLNIKGNVVPITLEKCELMYMAQGGSVTRGEAAIDKIDFSGDQHPNISYTYPVQLNPRAKKSLEDADVIIIAPGSLYSSLIPLLIIDDVPNILQTSKAKIIYAANIVNKPSETKGYHVDDYVQELERFAGAGVIDYVLYNTDRPTEQMLRKYARENEFLVDNNPARFKKAKYIAIGGNFLSDKSANLTSDDPLFEERSLIRHNGDALSEAILKICNK